MRAISRRQLLGGAVGIGGPVLFYGCSSESEAGKTTPGADAAIDTLLEDAGAEAAVVPLCDEPMFANATLLGTIDFAEEHDVLETPTGAGLNGRLYTDLTKLAPDALVTP